MERSDQLRAPVRVELRVQQNLAKQLQGTVDVGGINRDDHGGLLRPEVSRRVGGLNVDVSPCWLLHRLGQRAWAVLDLCEHDLIN